MYVVNLTMYIMMYLKCAHNVLAMYIQCTLNVHVLLHTMNMHCMYKNIPLKVHLIYNAFNVHQHVPITSNVHLKVHHDL